MPKKLTKKDIDHITETAAAMTALGVSNMSIGGDKPWVQLRTDSFIRAVEVMGVNVEATLNRGGSTGDYYTGEFTVDGLRFCGVIQDEDLHHIRHTIVGTVQIPVKTTS